MNVYASGMALAFPPSAISFQFRIMGMSTLPHSPALHLLAAVAAAAPPPPVWNAPVQ